jgi:hypothetical protein
LFIYHFVLSFSFPVCPPFTCSLIHSYFPEIFKPFAVRLWLVLITVPHWCIFQRNKPTVSQHISPHSVIRSQPDCLSSPLMNPQTSSPTSSTLPPNILSTVPVDWITALLTTLADVIQRLGFFPGTGNWTQGLMTLRQAPTTWLCTPSPILQCWRIKSIFLSMGFNISHHQALFGFPACPPLHSTLSHIICSGDP